MFEQLIKWFYLLQSGIYMINFINNNQIQYLLIDSTLMAIMATKPQVILLNEFNTNVAGVTL